jgi:hypothetical protein
MTSRDQQDWLTLDNAARIYPAALAEWSPDLYRVSVTLKAPIRVSALRDALRTVFPRFPYFQVHLQRGLFWYFLQRDDEIPELYPMSDVPTSVMPTQWGSRHLLRVQARGATIAVDFSHVLTDGAGAVCFLGTLVTQYLHLRGVHVTRWEPFFDPGARPAAGEFEDAYKRYFDQSLPGPARLSPAYHLPGETRSRYRVISGRLPVSDMLELARTHGVSLTEYLVALYIHGLAQVRSLGDDGGGIVRIEVPVDVRRVHPSKTMRNFSLFVSPEIDTRLGAFGFDEIVQRTHHGMRMQVDRRELDRQIARNVRAERNPFIRILPLFLKDLMISYVRKRFGERPYSGVLSNLGRIEVPEEIDDHIESFGVILGPNSRAKKNCALVSFRNDLVINFGSVIESREVERVFFTHLAEAGARVVLTERTSDS